MSLGAPLARLLLVLVVAGCASGKSGFPSDQVDAAPSPPDAGLFIDAPRADARVMPDARPASDAYVPPPDAWIDGSSSAGFCEADEADSIGTCLIDNCADLLLAPGGPSLTDIASCAATKCGLLLIGVDPQCIECVVNGFGGSAGLDITQLIAACS